MSGLSIQQKITALNNLLDQLHGYYLQVHQRYTNDPNDRQSYEDAYRQAQELLSLCEKKYNALLLTSPEEVQAVKTKYDNYSGYARFYIYTQCKPPHPSSLSSFIPI